MTSSGARLGRDAYVSLDAAASEAKIPVLILTAELKHETILGLRELTSVRQIISWSEHRKLAQAIAELAVRPVFEYVQGRIRSRFVDRLFVRSTLQKVVGQVPPPVSRALEAMSRDEVPFYRKVKDVARMMGVSRTYMWRAFRGQEFALGDVLRENTLLHGMSLYKRGHARQVAWRLGYDRVETWRASVRRAVGDEVSAPDDSGRRKVLTHAGSLPMGFYTKRLLNVMGVEDEKP